MNPSQPVGGGSGTLRRPEGGFSIEIFKNAWKMCITIAMQQNPEASSKLIESYNELKRRISQDGPRDQNGIIQLVSWTQQEFVKALGTERTKSYFETFKTCLSEKRSASPHPTQQPQQPQLQTQQQQHHHQQQQFYQQQVVQHQQQLAQQQKMAATAQAQHQQRLLAAQQKQAQQQQQQIAHQQYAQQRQQQHIAQQQAAHQHQHQMYANQHQQFYQQQVAAQQKQQAAQQQHPAQQAQHPMLQPGYAAAPMRVSQSLPPTAVAAAGSQPMGITGAIPVLSQNPNTLKINRTPSPALAGSAAGAGGGATDKAAAGRPPKAVGTKRSAAEVAAGDGDPMRDGAGSKAKRLKGKARKRGDEDGGDGGGDGDGEKMTLGGQVIDLEAETNAAMDSVERARREGMQRERPAGGGRFATASDVQYLSGWRLVNEVLQQRKDKGDGPPIDQYLDPAVLNVLQLGFSAQATEVVNLATRVAKQRGTSLHRRTDFVQVGDDPRRGLGTLRRAAEEAAAAKAAVEREKLLKEAASKRADDETKERAQRAKAEIAGQQQVVAANKALAATLGGRDAKWAKWASAGSAAGEKGAGGDGAGVSGAAAAAREKEKADGGAVGGDKEKGGAEEGEGGEGGAGGGALQGYRSRGDLVEGAGAAGAGPASADGSIVVQLQDVVVAMQQNPMYCRSMVLYRLLNGMDTQ